jgi:glycoside/pentoside/hexuronide:cation symporter, GPH family
VMGGLVDRTSTRWGRFAPFLFTGGLLFGLGLALLFNPPAFPGQVPAFLYLLSMYILVNTGVTILGVPHIAMGGVLSSDTHERTELYGWRLVFGTLGVFAGILSPLLAASLLGADVEEPRGLRDSRGLGSWIMGLAVIAAAWVTVFATWKRSLGLPAPVQAFRWSGFLKHARRVLTNRIFMPFFVAFLIVAAARAMNASLALPYYKDTLDLPEPVIQSAILGVFALCIVLSVPFWVVMGRRFGKTQPAFVAMLVLGVLTAVAYPLFPPGFVIGPVLVAVVGGFAVGAIILVESLVTDVADEDFVRHGEDSEGIYFGFWRMGQKIARSLTLALTGVLLGAIGYQESLAEQSHETRRALAWIFGAGVGGLFVAASLIFRKTPVDRARQEAIQREKQRRLAGSVVAIPDVTPEEP